VIQAIISDFGGVLTTPLLGSFARFQERVGIPAESLRVAMQAIEARDGENPLFGLERGEVTEAHFFGTLGAEISAQLGREVHLGDFAEHYFSGLDPLPPMIEYLGEVKARRGIRLALLTNNVREWEPRWRAMLPVDELFELVVDSAFVGMRKPDPRIYELTLSGLGLPAEACAFVDDLEPNIVAARELGLHAVHFADAEQAIGELETLLGPAA